jgi:hypothetical protein
LIKDLRDLVTGNSPVELMQEMFRVLVTYARAFERCRSFRIQMGLRREDIINIRNINSKDPDFERGMDYRAENPYRIPHPHPVENGLEGAKDALVADNMAAFKTYRRNVLAYLEKQYLRIERAGFKLNDFVKYEKVALGLFSTQSGAMQWKARYDKRAYLAWILLRDYSDSFIRDAPDLIRAEVRRQMDVNQKHFKAPSVSLDRDSIISELAGDIRIDDTSNFRHNFQAVVNDCDAQYLKIFLARKELFKWDLYNGEKVRCGVTTEYFRCPEKVKWRFTEPNLTPRRGPPSNEIEDDETDYDFSPGSSLYSEAYNFIIRMEREEDSTESSSGEAGDEMDIDYDSGAGADDDIFDYRGVYIGRKGVNRSRSSK